MLQQLSTDAPSANSPVSSELDRGTNDLLWGQEKLTKHLTQWRRTADREHVLIADTNVFLHHQRECHHIPWEDIVRSGVDEPIHLVVPLVVVDELDSAKRRSQTRTRARRALKQLDRLIYRPDHPFRIRDSSQDGVITVRILSEDVRHVRIPTPDAELIDVALGLESLIGRDITNVTFDSGMVVRAQTAQLEVRKLEESDEIRPSVRAVASSEFWLHGRCALVSRTPVDGQPSRRLIMRRFPAASQASSAKG